MSNINIELMAAKTKLSELQNKVDDVDLNSRKGLSELSDKVEIERLLSDMINKVASIHI
jgi:hypothetical protein